MRPKPVVSFLSAYRSELFNNAAVHLAGKIRGIIPYQPAFRKYDVVAEVVEADEDDPEAVHVAQNVVNAPVFHQIDPAGQVSCVLQYFSEPVRLY